MTENNKQQPLLPCREVTNQGRKNNIENSSERIENNTSQTFLKVVVSRTWGTIANRRTKDQFQSQLLTRPQWSERKL